MSSFTYTTGIPATPNNPSVDQPNMQQNTNAINSWVQVDHIGFNNASISGQHVQVTFNAPITPAVQSGLQSVLYTSQGTASTDPQLFYDNTIATVQVSSIRAWAYFSGASGAILSSQSFNVASITRVSTGAYSITLDMGAVSSASFGVNATCSNSGTTVAFVTAFATGFSGGQGTLTIFAQRITSGGTAAIDPDTITFSVFQI